MILKLYLFVFYDLLKFVPFHIIITTFHKNATHTVHDNIFFFFLLNNLKKIKSGNFQKVAENKRIHFLNLFLSKNLNISYLQTCHYDFFKY